MTMRRVYGERSALVVKDLKDQPEDNKYIALVEGIGEKQAISFNKVLFNGPTVVLLDPPSKLADKEGPMVAAFPLESKWVIILRDRFLEMTGTEWEESKLADGKNGVEIMKKLYGEKGIVGGTTLPSGMQLVTPATAEQEAEYERQQAMNTARNSGGEGLYL